VYYKLTLENQKTTILFEVIPIFSGNV